MRFATALTVLGLAASATAKVYITQPIGAPVQAGGLLNVVWQDDGEAPTLKDIGTCTVDICVGSATQQTCLLRIGDTNVDVATTISNSIPRDIGPSGSDYFVRIQSSNLKNESTGYPYQSFSPKFPINGATGTFNSTIQAQINGTYTPSANNAGNTASSNSTSKGASNASPASSPVSSQSSSKPSPASAQSSTSPSPARAATNTNGAGSLAAPALGGFIAVVVGALAML